jgi:hypothetical protein
MRRPWKALCQSAAPMSGLPASAQIRVEMRSRCWTPVGLVVLSATITVKNTATGQLCVIVAKRPGKLLGMQTSLKGAGAPAHGRASLKSHEILARDQGGLRVMGMISLLSALSPQGRQCIRLPFEHGTDCVNQVRGASTISAVH